MSESAGGVRISLVIPVKDEAATIARLLDSISRQRRLPDEVVFVNAGSTDETANLIQRHKDDRLRLKMITVKAAYPGTARNLGVEAAEGGTIAFTDAGIELDDDWLGELSRVVEEDASVDVVYGSYSPRADTFFKECFSIAFVEPARRLGLEKGRTHFIASSLLKKSVWQDVGGFPDFRAAEDRIFMQRIAQEGRYRIRHNPKARVIWDIPGTPMKAFMRFFNYSYHDLRAGRAADWHLGVLKMYLVASSFVFLGIFAAPAFFLAPFIGLALRSGGKTIANRDEPYFRRSRAPSYLVCVSLLILLIDLAMFAGWFKYIIRER